MESRAPVSGTSCIVQARRHVPSMVKVWTAWPRSKATRFSLRRFFMIDHTGRIRKVSLPGFAIPQNPELKIDGFTRPSREISNVVPNAQTIILRRRDRWNESVSGKLFNGGKTDLAGPGAVSTPERRRAGPFEMAAPLEV